MTRPPADAIVTLRSLSRRWRGLFAGLGTDEAPDDLAHRLGSDGQAASDHAVRATRTLALLDRALEQLLLDDTTVLHPAVGDATQRQWDSHAEGSVDDLIAELVGQAERLADRADGVAAADWARRAPVAGHDADVGALELLWDAVDSAISELKAAERTLGEVRGRPAS